MIDYKYAELFNDDSVTKHVTIEYDTTVITNEDLFNQTLTFEESLCSESELRFGSCEASVLKFKVANIVAPMFDKWITVKMVLEGHSDTPFVFGKYKVKEDKVTADRQWREITAYDALYDIINADAAEVAAWYNGLFPSKDSTLKLKQFRTSFLNRYGLEQVLPQEGLVNDNMLVGKTIEPEQLSGQTVITAICEINGCFGHIGRDGKLHYIYLPQAIQGLYPANDLYPDHAPDYLPYQQRTGHLYPQDPKGTRIGANGTYISCQYEDYLCKTIDKLQIRQEENDIGVIVGRDGDNCYIVEDNFLVYGKGSEELRVIANNIFNKITDIVYRPFNADIKGNPCLEVGDPIRLTTKYELVESYILQRTLKGIQALRDNLTADGAEMYSDQVNGIHKSIVQLKGKTNVLTRSIEETKSELKDTANKLSTAITQNAEKIKLEAERATGAEKELAASIEVLAGKIVLKVNSAGDIALVQLSADPNSGTTFKVKAGNLQLSAEDVINIMAGGDLRLSGKNIKISADNFSVSPDGTVRCNKIIEFGIEGNARNSFNGYVSSAPAVTTAQSTADGAAEAAAKAQQAIDDVSVVVRNLNNTIIPQINTWINQISSQLRALGQPGIS